LFDLVRKELNFSHHNHGLGANFMFLFLIKNEGKKKKKKKTRKKFVDKIILFLKFDVVF
jgi:hypothetical protein